MILKIKRCYINRRGELKLGNHPYYKALQDNSAEAYNRAVLYSRRQQKKETATWEGINKLIETIKQNGFDTKNSPILFYKNQKGKFVCKRGRHRLCILYHIYGENLKLTISKNNYLTDITINKKIKKQIKREIKLDKISKKQKKQN